MSEKKHEDYCGYSQGACTCAVASPQATRAERICGNCGLPLVQTETEEACRELDKVSTRLEKARAVAPVETPQRQHTKDCCLDLDHKSDCKRWMKLPPNSAYPNFKEIHVQDDWCPKAGCVPASQCDITAAHGAAQQIGAPVETPRCPFGYTKEMPGTKHDCAIHKSSDYDAQTRLTAEQLRQKIYDFWKRAKGDFGQASWQKLVRDEIEAFRDKSEAPLQEELKSSEEIRSAEKKILLAEIEKNTWLREEIERLTRENGHLHDDLMDRAGELTELRAKLAEQERTK